MLIGIAIFFKRKYIQEWDVLISLPSSHFAKSIATIIIKAFTALPYSAIGETLVSRFGNIYFTTLNLTRLIFVS